MKKTLLVTCLTPLLLLSACGDGPDTQAPDSVPATPEEIAAQLAEYEQKSEDLVAKVSDAMKPGATAQSMKAAGLSPALQKKLSQLRKEVLTKHPEIAKQNVWIGESSQLITPDDVRNVTSKLNGLLVVVTNDPDNPRKVAVVAKLKVNIDRNELRAYHLSDELKGGYMHPGLKNIQKDGGVPYVRRVNKPVSDIDVYHPPLELMNLDTDYTLYTKQGEVIR